MTLKSPSTALIPIETVGTRILLIRGQKVMLDRDLAELYGVPTKVLNQAVRRNRLRFPADFMFQLTKQEADAILKSQFVTSSVISVGNPRFLRSQIATLKSDWGGRRKRPHAFTEQGVAMLSSVLHSPRAIHVNIAIMRAFVQLRQWLSSHADLARKLEEMEQKYDAQFRSIFEAIQALATSPPIPENTNTIGFKFD